ncbi:MAG: UxaA family hydrolase [Armatimonadota bacterium]
MSVRAIRAHARDNVATVVQEVAAGEEVVADLEGEETTVASLEAIPAGHKVALRDVAEGGEVIKYGEVIGRTTQAVAAGAHVHLHNMASQRVWRVQGEPSVGGSV